jgi:hypothetical protein
VAEAEDAETMAPLPPPVDDEAAAPDVGLADAAPPPSNVAAAPTSMVPNMIGDSGAAGTWSTVQPPSQAITNTFSPVSGPWAGVPGRSQAAQAVDGLPVTFVYFGDTINGVVIPPTNFNSLSNRELLAPLAPGGSFPLDGGSSAYQAATEASTVAGLGPGTATFDSMEAVLNIDDGAPGGAVTTNDFFYLYEYLTYTPAPISIFIPSPSGPGAVVGTTKIAENSSALPQDRFFLNYSYFDNAAIFPGGVNVSRFSPGFEKTFLCGNASLEMRFPMSVTLDSTIISDDGTDLSHGEFGNLALTPKVLLCRNRQVALAAGMTIALPTADDVNVVMTDGTHLVRIDNEAVHLMPFVGWLWTPNPCWYAQGFLQYDVATAGNPVGINLDGTGLESAGSLSDTTFQYLDLAIGRWVYRSCQSMSCQRLRSVAVTGELHWNKSLEAGDYIESGNFLVGNTATNVDLWDATIGLHVRLCDTTISAAYVTPIGGGLDQPFDGEFRLIVNRWFGRSSEAYGSGTYPGVFP